MPPMKRNSNAVIQRIKTLKRKWAREGRTCTYCDITLRYDASGLPDSVEADHVLPVSLGGHPLGEMIPACRLHNQRRGNKSVEEFKQLLRDEQRTGKRLTGKPTPPDIPEVKRPLLW